MKMIRSREKFKNLYLDIVRSSGWGVDKNFNVDSDDENLQKRINRLNEYEHKTLGEFLGLFLEKGLSVMFVHESHTEHWSK